MKISNQADKAELDSFLGEHPEIKTLEVLIPDLNGILRGKRIPIEEARELYGAGIKNCGSTPLMSCKGETIEELGLGTVDGDPDMIILPVADTIAPVPWLKSPIGQVLVGTNKPDGKHSIYDPRNILHKATQPLAREGMHAVIATELEFYLLENSTDQIPRPLLGRIPGTGLKQDGVQYAMMEDLWECDDFLSAVRETCALQKVPATTAHSEFSPGQMEINLHHVDDPVTACDHAMLLKRLIKGEARRHDIGASFMAKPFQDFSGCGLHIHISIYDSKGRNVFARKGSRAKPPISETMRHAIGGLEKTMAEAMAIFAPNANSYRRLQPGTYVPLKPNWGYNHRSVALRIPVSDPDNMRIEHRVAGADSNPYLVVAAVLAGIHHGITTKCKPGPMVSEGTFYRDEEVTLPVRWDDALARFDAGKILPHYLGKEFCRIFSVCRHSESDQFHAQISNRDYEWYLRAV